MLGDRTAQIDRRCGSFPVRTDPGLGLALKGLLGLRDRGRRSKYPVGQAVQYDPRTKTDSDANPLLDLVRLGARGQQGRNGQLRDHQHLIAPGQRFQRPAAAMAWHIQDHPVVDLAGHLQHAQDGVATYGFERGWIAHAGHQIQTLADRGHKGLQHGCIDPVGGVAEV